jgi:hypothetical protein
MSFFWYYSWHILHTNYDHRMASSNRTLSGIIKCPSIACSGWGRPWEEVLVHLMSLLYGRASKWPDTPRPCLLSDRILLHFSIILKRRRIRHGWKKKMMMMIEAQFPQASCQASLISEKQPYVAKDYFGFSLASMYGTGDRPYCRGKSTAQWSPRVSE